MYLRWRGKSTVFVVIFRIRYSNFMQVEKGPMWQLLFWISVAEILLSPTVINMGEKDREPGDFGLDPLNVCKVWPHSY